MIVGKRDLVEKIRCNQLARALRVDKFTIAALEATLRLYLDEDAAVREIPIWRALTADPDILRGRAESLARRLEPVFGPGGVDVIPGSSRVGGGALPTAELPTFLVALDPPLLEPAQLAERLRFNSPPVIARVQQERLLLDPRTIEERQEEALIQALARAVRG
jgi:L-seryl-tRNA(Ser) seleniumtransferase